MDIAQNPFQEAVGLQLRPAQFPFGPAVLFALFWKRSNRQGILAGLVAGGVMVFVWKFCVRPIGGVWNVYELLPAFIVASAAIVVVSMLTPKPSADTPNL